MSQLLEHSMKNLTLKEHLVASLKNTKTVYTRGSSEERRKSKKKSNVQEVKKMKTIIIGNTIILMHNQ